MGRVVRRKYKFGSDVRSFGIEYRGKMRGCTVISSNVPGSMVSGVYSEAHELSEDLSMELGWDLDDADGRAVNEALVLGKQQGRVIGKAVMVVGNSMGEMRNTYYDLSIKAYELIEEGRCRVVFGIRASKVERMVGGIVYENEE